jgi:phospholipase C
MDGFIITADQPPGRHKDNYPDEVVGYHTCDELPVYCGYAEQGVLADNQFAATSSWSTMAHLYMVSGWSAKCSVAGDPISCTSNNDVNVHAKPPPDFAWTDITWLLHAHAVSWGYFVYDKTTPFLQGDGDDELPSPYDVYNKEGLWNPLPGFDDVRLDGESANVQPGANFETLAAAGMLPAVSWVIPSFDTSDHPPQSVVSGQQWTQTMVNAVENGPDASSTLIILAWDEWGGFYDHVMPPTIDGLGYGFRTPLILIGPMVKHGYIDHQLLSSDAYLKLIEDNFMGGLRLDPLTDGRPDPRPDVRENYPGLGDLRNDLMP